MSRWLAAAALLGCWGCAFSLDGPDPNRPANRVPRCDTSKGLVALDGVMATMFGVSALALSADSEPGLALVPLAVGVVYLAGAVSGNRAVDKCLQKVEAYELAYGGQRMVLPDGDEGVPDDEEDDEEDRRPRGRMFPRSTRAERGAQSTPQVPPQPYSQPSPPQQPPPQQHAPAQQPLPAGPMKQSRRAVAAPSDEAETEWSDFWREVP